MDPEVADAVNYLLQGVVRNGTGRPADIDRPQAGKTGTSEGFSAWFIGYTPNLAAAVGVWDPRGRAGGVCGKRAATATCANVSIGGRTFDRLQGRQLPAPLWARR
jgi:membrane peptidoglycan carboxypeptidase